MNVFERKRKENNLTQTELGELLNIDRSAISKWETGDAMPNLLNLTKLAEIYSCPLGDLVNSETLVK